DRQPHPEPAPLDRFRSHSGLADHRTYDKSGPATRPERSASKKTLAAGINSLCGVSAGPNLDRTDRTPFRRKSFGFLDRQDRGVVVALRQRRRRHLAGPRAGASPSAAANTKRGAWRPPSGARPRDPRKVSKVTAGRTGRLDAMRPVPRGKPLD